MKKAVAYLIDAALNRYAPIVHTRSAAAFTDDMGGADLLADLEADLDVWEPSPISQRRKNAATDLPAGVEGCETPSYAVASATGAGGFPTKPDGVATVIAVVLRGQGINSSAIYADLIARELRHHFNVTPK